VPGKIGWGRALGVYLAEGRLTLTEIAATPAGTKVLSVSSESIGEEGPGAALARWMESRLTVRQRRRLRVCVGLSAEQTFFATRAMGEDRPETPTVDELLAASPTASPDPASAAADFVRFKLAGNAICTIAACQRALAEGLYQSLRRLGVREFRMEPAPWSVLDVADRMGKSPKGWKTHLRVLLGGGKGLAMLVADGRPIFWRRFALPAAQEIPSIISAVRHLEIFAQQSLGIREIAGVILQGDVTAELADRFRDESGQETIATPHAPLDEKTYSLAMAQTARKVKPDSLDLFRTLRPPPTLREMFPARLAGALATGVALMALVLWDTSSDLEAEYRSLCGQCASHKWAAKEKTRALNKERKALMEEAGAVQKFLATRVVWSDYLRDLPTRLPTNACLTHTNGAFEMQDMSASKQKKKSHRSLTLRGMAQFSDRGSAPREIDAFLDSLRNVELLKRDFPQVSLAEIKWRKDVGGDSAIFTIVAMPKEKAVHQAGGD